MRANRLILSLTFICTALLLWSGCSDLEQPVPVAPSETLNVHPEGWSLDVNNPNFHGRFIRSIGWDLRNCQQCHGADYMGGISESSCIPCHQETPEDCIVCHGGEDSDTGAPPVDLNDNVATTNLTVGLHTLHLNGGSLGNGVNCVACHIVPDSLFATAHLDESENAEVIFADLAIGGGVMPGWNRNQAQCSNTYCHGNWELERSESNWPQVYTGVTMAGNNATAVWTAEPTEDCGSCHGMPPSGHVPYSESQCGVCHSTVVDRNANIIDKSRHINGRINVFLQELPMF